MNNFLFLLSSLCAAVFTLGLLVVIVLSVTYSEKQVKGRNQKKIKMHQKRIRLWVLVSVGAAIVLIVLLFVTQVMEIRDFKSRVSRIQSIEKIRFIYNLDGQTVERDIVSKEILFQFSKRLSLASGNLNHNHNGPIIEAKMIIFSRGEHFEFQVSWNKYSMKDLYIGPLGGSAKLKLEGMGSYLNPDFPGRLGSLQEK